MRAAIKAISCVPITLMLACGPQAFAQNAGTPESGATSARSSATGQTNHAEHMAGRATHPMMNPAIRAFMAAERLAALHTFLGITPDQEDAWRKFCNAVLDMASTAPNIMALAATDDVFETMDNVATGSHVLAEKVTHAREVLQALHAVLRPEQVKRANEAFVALRSMLIAQLEGAASGASGSQSDQ